MLTPWSMHMFPTMGWKGAGSRLTTTSLVFTRLSSLSVSEVTSKQMPSPNLASPATLFTSASTLPHTMTFRSSLRPTYSANELATRPAPSTRTCFWLRSVTTAGVPFSYTAQVASALGSFGTRSSISAMTLSFWPPVTERTAWLFPSSPLTSILIMSTSHALSSTRSSTLFMRPLSNKCPSSWMMVPSCSSTAAILALALTARCSFSTALLSWSMYLNFSVSSP
mmetsp:Transcript_4122/g.7708  ORF Transcript_4122/g.7708 Transcript_4122/m.7708 type:complete len:224 (+) Transcript_4122:1098-1769(+)